MGAHCQKQERYIPYKGHQISCNSTIGTQSIDTNFVPSNGSTVRSTESIADAFTGTSSADRTGIELDQDNLGERLARLEKMFNPITDLTDSYYSVQLEPDPHAQTSLLQDLHISSLHGPLASSLHGSQASSSHAPPASLLHDSQSFLLHDPTSTDKNEEPRGKLRDQYITLRGSNRLRSSTDCQENHEAVRIKLELGSETIGLTSSPAKMELGSETIGLTSSPAKHCGLRESRETEEVKESLRTLKDHEDWLDGVHDQQFGTSTPKEEPSKALQEHEEWFDHEETDSEENGSFWLLYSEKEQTKANELKSTEPAELHGLPGDDSSDVSSSHQEIWDSKSMIDSANTEFRWDSMETKELRLRQKGEVEVPVLESLEYYEDFIDNAYFARFGTLTPNVEASSTSREYEEWIDKKFEETFNTSAQEDLCKNDESIQREDSVKRLDAAIERFYPTISNATMNLHGVTPYPAWDPAEENTCSINSSLGDITICQLSSTSALRIPGILHGIALKAVVDTAAMVTILSDKVYREMKTKPPCPKVVTLQTAGRDMKMDGRIVGPVSLKLGNTTFPEVVHVAPIQDDILLGLDFLLKHRVDIKLKELQLHIRAADERVPLEALNSKMEQNTVAKFTAERVEHIPACPTARVKSNYPQERANCILVWKPLLHAEWSAPNTQLKSFHHTGYLPP